MIGVGCCLRRETGSNWTKNRDDALRRSAAGDIVSGDVAA
jgi:hypothetical protein